LSEFLPLSYGDRSASRLYNNKYMVDNCNYQIYFVEDWEIESHTKTLQGFPATLAVSPVMGVGNSGIEPLALVVSGPCSTAELISNVLREGIEPSTFKV
jgi:hypothetical protein